jgi:hypothetical protein
MSNAVHLITVLQHQLKLPPIGLCSSPAPRQSWLLLLLVVHQVCGLEEEGVDLQCVWYMVLKRAALTAMCMHSLC